MQGSTKLFCTALHTLLMMTAEFMLSKRPVLRFTAALFYLLKLFSSHIYCIPNNTTLFFLCVARVVMAQPQWPANGQASLQLFKTNVGSLFSLCCALLKFERFCSFEVSAIQNAENVARKAVIIFKTSAKKTALLKSCIKEEWCL